jgi:hypothetical protein
VKTKIKLYVSFAYSDIWNVWLGGISRFRCVGDP